MTGCPTVYVPVFSNGGLQHILHDLKHIPVAEDVEASFLPVDVVALMLQFLVSVIHLPCVVDTMGADSQRPQIRHPFSNACLQHSQTAIQLCTPGFSYMVFGYMVFLALFR